MRGFIIAGTIATVITGTAAAEQRAQYQQVRPASIDPRQVGIDTSNRTQPEIERAKCLKRKVKERRDCLTRINTAPPKTGS